LVVGDFPPRYVGSRFVVGAVFCRLPPWQIAIELPPSFSSFTGIQDKDAKILHPLPPVRETSLSSEWSHSLCVHPPPLAKPHPILWKILMEAARPSPKIWDSMYFTPIILGARDGYLRSRYGAFPFWFFSLRGEPRSPLCAKSGFSLPLFPRKWDSFQLHKGPSPYFSFSFFPGRNAVHAPPPPPPPCALAGFLASFLI